MTDIDLKELFKALLKRWWILFICTALFGAGASLYSNYYIVPVYQSYTTMYVGRSANQNDTLTQQDLSLGLQVIMDYREIAKSKQVASEVIRKMGIEGMNPGSMAAKINIDKKNDTRVIIISVNDTDPRMAMDIANTVAEVLQQKIIQIMQLENVQIIDRAEIPNYPISPNNTRNTQIGTLLGLILGAAIAFLIFYLDDTIKTPDDVQKHIGLPVIGAIPRFQKLIKGLKKGKSKTVILHANPKSPISEAYRVLRTNIQYSSFDKQLKTFVVTSSSPMEGKSTTIINLAVAFAQAGNRVLLIDTDLRKPTIQDIFGFPDRRGLTNYLVLHNGTEKIEYKKFIRISDIENLDIMSCGVIPPNPSELLSSNSMKHFVEQVRDDYDLVFFDAPPIGNVTDAAIISTYCDGTILVVSSGNAKIGAIQRANDLLDKVNANKIGVVLNKLDKSANKSYYNSQYYYYGEDKTGKWRKNRKHNDLNILEMHKNFNNVLDDTEKSVNSQETINPKNPGIPEKSSN